jgi:hypothetical protein
MHFSYDLEASLTAEEHLASEKLRKLREEIVDEEKMNVCIHNFFENKEFIEKSKIFKVLNMMPKGAIHHLHTSAANPIDAFLKLTYDERVYFCSRDRLFKVFPKHIDVDDGYVKCIDLR